MLFKQPALPTVSEPATASAGIVVSIQYLRAVAAALVVLHHAFAPPPLQAIYKTAFGVFGVDIFFVISGYIIWSTTARSQRSPATFWVARIVRVVPLYWIFTTLFLAAAVFQAQSLFSRPDLAPLYILKSYLFVPARNTAGEILPLYSLGWTLNYEIFFYFIFGISLLFENLALRCFLLIATFASLATTGYILELTTPVAATFTAPILLEFVAGVVVAVSAPSLMRLPMMVGAFLIFAAVVWLIVALAHYSQTPHVVIYGAPAVSVVAGGLVFERIVRQYPSKILLVLGAASYSTYLAHPFAQRAWFIVCRTIFDVNSPVAASLLIGGAVILGILAGVLSWLLIERLLLGVLNAWTKSKADNRKVF